MALVTSISLDVSGVTLIALLVWEAIFLLVVEAVVSVLTRSTDGVRFRVGSIVTAAVGTERAKEFLF